MMNPEKIDSGGSAGGDDCAQRLSRLIDGELDADECRALVERLRQDDDACRQWALLNCVGDALRSPEVAAWHSSSFVDRVSAALEREPTVLAPAALRSGAGMRRWLWPGAGAAVAASVLLAIGLGSRQVVSPEAIAARAPQATAVAGIERSPVLERYLAAHRELAEPALMPSSTPYVRTSGAIVVQESR